MRETNPIPQPTPSERERFDAKYTTPEEGCWEWHAARASGYGRFRMRGKTVRAHRLLFAWTYPEIDITGRDLDHIVCDNRKCVRPDHLVPSTPKANIIRGKGPSGVNHRKTHCVRGHKFTRKNTQLDARGKRNCRECWRIRKRMDIEKNGEKINERKRKAYVAVSYPDRQCATCGETFTPGRKNGLYCKPSCQQSRMR